MTLQDGGGQEESHELQGGGGGGGDGGGGGWGWGGPSEGQAESHADEFRG